MRLRWTIAAIVGAAIAVVGPLLITRHRSLALEGAVILKDPDPKKESPIAGVKVSVAPEGGLAVETATTDFSGYFVLRLPPRFVDGQSVTLRFQHPDHRPLDVVVPIAEQLYVIRMSPNHPEIRRGPAQPDVVISDIVVRYTVESRTAINIGSGARTFDIPNHGNLPCDRHPCSPDGKWKAADGAVSLDAGAGNEFRNARLSCIAGPCPFTHVESDRFSRAGQVISATVRNWSDTVTFSLEAEVFQPQNTDAIQRSYPIILGRGLNFTLAGSAQGVTIEAEVDGTPIVFPLPPNGTLSWTACDIRVQKDQAHLYRCELKPGYVFKKLDGE
jgi:hypothetical protein